MFLVETIREQENLQNGENYTVWCRLRPATSLDRTFSKTTKSGKLLYVTSATVRFFTIPRYNNLRLFDVTTC